MAREKETSHEGVAVGQAVTIRPHILLCAVCQYGGGTRPPFKADNLPELLEMILHKNPDVSITLARGGRLDDVRAVPAAGCRAERLREHAGLRRPVEREAGPGHAPDAGPEFGSTMKARELFRLIFEKIPTTQEVCKREAIPARGLVGRLRREQRQEREPQLRKGQKRIYGPLSAFSPKFFRAFRRNWTRSDRQGQNAGHKRLTSQWRCHQADRLRLIFGQSVSNGSIQWPC